MIADLKHHRKVVIQNNYELQTTLQIKNISIKKNSFQAAVQRTCPVEVAEAEADTTRASVVRPLCHSRHSQITEDSDTACPHAV